MKLLSKTQPSVRSLSVEKLRSLRPSRAAAAAFAAALLLCPVSFGYGPLPLAICVLCVCRARTLGAAAGGVLLGYALFWGLGRAFEFYAVGAVLVSARIVFRGRLRCRALLILIAASCAVIGGLFVIEQRFTVPALAHWAINTAAGTVCCAVFFAAKQGSDAARTASTAIMLLGLYTVPLPLGLDLAFVVLAWMAAAPGAVPAICAGCGLLALVYPAATAYAAVFCLAVFFCRALSGKPRFAAFWGSLGVYTLFSLRMKSLLLLPCAVLGAAAAIILPPDKLFPVKKSAVLPEQPLSGRLALAAQAMTCAGEMLNITERSPQRELAEVVETARLQICRNCAISEKCIRQHPVSADIAAFDASVLASASAEMSDLPTRIRTQCLHPEAYLTAVNDGLDALRTGRRVRRRFDEARSAAHTHFMVTGHYLQALSRSLYAPQTLCTYQPEISVQALGSGGSRLSGDRGAAFRGPDDTYYVLVCDGMGTGSAAGAQSAEAIELLQSLLRAGFDAENALRELNCAYILRDNGCFSTVDLLRVSLTSGAAILYKLGAAPSYLKRNRGVRQLGCGTPPPGVSAKQDMEILHFSLDRGSVLIMLTDGLYDAETLRRLESCESLHPRDVTGSLFLGRETPEDDATAVAIRIQVSHKR